MLRPFFTKIEEEMEQTTFYKGDCVRMEVSPSGDNIRWRYHAFRGWLDLGKSGNFVEGTITKLVDEEYPFMQIEGTILVGTKKEEHKYVISLPLEGHPKYTKDLYSFPGMPVVISRKIETKCECGEDAAIRFGASPGCHSRWCPKYIPLT